jgi:hypothetical protein
MMQTGSTYVDSYSATWAEFVGRITSMGPKQKRKLQAEATTCGRITIVLSAQRAHLAAYSTADAQRRIQRRTAAEIEAARMTVRYPDARRQRVSISAFRALGPARLTTRSASEVKADRRAAKIFFRKVDAGALAKKAAREAALSHELWRLMNPTEEMTTIGDMKAWEALRKEVRPMLGCPPDEYKPRNGFVPVGMSRERALEIAINAR